MWRSAVAHHRAAGHEVRVLTTDWRERYLDDSTPDDPDVHRELRWYWHDHAFPRMGPLARLALERHNAGVLDRHLSAFRPDAVGWWAMGGMSLSMIERVRAAGLPATAVVVDDWLLYGPKVDAWWRMLRRGVGRLEGACRWLFASEMLLSRAREARFRPAEVRVVHPGIDSDLFGGLRGKKTHSAWNWQLLYCGRVDERKGIDIAVQALAHLPPEATLRIVGGGDDRHLAELRALIDRLGLAGRVTLERHPRADLPAVYAAADALLFPVRWLEPFGLVPLEGMACGTPVIASGRGGSGEYLRDDENCLLFDVDRGPGALAARVRRLADDPGLRERLAAGGRAAAARFREDVFNDAVLQTLQGSR